MGVDFDALIGHHLTAADVPRFPKMLAADAAPGLARAVRQYAHAANRHTAALNREYNDLSLPFVTVDGDWEYEEPVWNTYLDSAGREIWTLDEIHSMATQNSPFRPHKRRMSVDEVWSEDSEVSILGPAGLHLILFRRCSLLSCRMRWYTFLKNDEVQQAFRRVARETAQLLNAPAALYIPDHYCPSGACDVYCPGGTFAEVASWLVEKCGPSAPSIASIYTEYDLPPRDGSPVSVWEGDGYFLDTFQDLQD